MSRNKNANKVLTVYIGLAHRLKSDLTTRYRRWNIPISETHWQIIKNEKIMLIKKTNNLFFPDFSLMNYFF